MITIFHTDVAKGSTLSKQHVVSVYILSLLRSISTNLKSVLPLHGKSTNYCN